MKTLELKNKCTIGNPGEPVLYLEYYLVKNSSCSTPIYGIQIQSHTAASTFPIFYAEEVSHLSYSKSEASRLLSRCVRYQVTPTDLLSALDLLMDYEK